jgi:hypothetical protein
MPWLVVYNNNNKGDSRAGQQNPSQKPKQPPKRKKTVRRRINPNRSLASCRKLISSLINFPKLDHYRAVYKRGSRR